MNVTLGGGKAVHAGHVMEGYKTTPECGGNRGAERFRETAAEVTCKNCLKWLAAEAERNELTAAREATIDRIPAAEQTPAAPVKDADAELFDQIYELELEAVGARASVTFAPMGLPDHLFKARIENHRAARKALYDAVGALTMGQTARYNAHRTAIRNAVA